MRQNLRLSIRRWKTKSLRPRILKHAPVVLNVSALEDPVNWSAMHKAVSATGLRVIGVSGCKDAQLKAEIEKMGLPILTEGKEKRRVQLPHRRLQRKIQRRSQKRV